MTHANYAKSHPLTSGQTVSPALELERSLLGQEVEKPLINVLHFFESNKIKKLLKANESWLENNKISRR